MSRAALHAEIAHNEGQICQYEASNNSLQAKIDALQAAYDSLKQAKRDFKSHKTGLNSYAKESRSGWKGDLFTGRFKNPIQEYLVNGTYSEVYSRIDSNMAVINNQICAYQNEIYRNNGIIGSLRAAINSLWTRIQNWID